MTISLGRELLAAVALHVRTTAVVGAADIEHVGYLIAAEIEHRGELIDALVVADTPEIEQVARRCLPTRGSLWSDPALFLRLNLVDWRVPEVLRRWPNEWLR